MLRWSYFENLSLQTVMSEIPQKKSLSWLWVAPRRLSWACKFAYPSIGSYLLKLLFNRKFASCSSWSNWWILSTGDDARPLSMEKWSDCNDVCPMGSHENRTMPGSTSQRLGSTGTRSYVHRMFGGRHDDRRQKVFGTLTVRHPHSGLGSGQGHALLSGSHAISRSKLHMR